MKISCRRKSQLVVLYQVVTDPFCGLTVIFCGFISHLIGCETINIPEIFSSVHGFMGKTVICSIFRNTILRNLSEEQISHIRMCLCTTLCVPSATRHNIHLYPYFLFAAIHHPKSSPTFSVRPCSSVGRVTVDLIRRSWVRFPPRSKDFFFASCGSLFPFTNANAQWVIHGFKVALKFTLQS